MVAPAPITQGLIGVGPNRARLTDGHAIVRFGINRVDRIAIRIPVETSGRVVARWNDQLAERTGTGTLELGGTALRGVNTLELEAPPGTIVSPIELTVVR